MDRMTELFPNPPLRRSAPSGTDQESGTMKVLKLRSPLDRIHDSPIDVSRSSFRERTLNSPDDKSSVHSQRNSIAEEDGDSDVSPRSVISSRSDSSSSNGIVGGKPRCLLHEEIINQEAFSEFIEFCTSVRLKNSGSDMGANCAAGFDEVGFFLCAFLVERRSWEPEAAISAVRKAREPGMCDQQCVDRRRHFRKPRELR